MKKHWHIWTPCILLILCLMNTNLLFGQYVEDESSIGYWEFYSTTGPESTIYRRSRAITPGKSGLHIMSNKTVIITKLKGNKMVDYTGNWWSPNPGILSYSYYDEALKKNIIERFEYTNATKKDFLAQWDYEEEVSTQDSGFVGCWRRATNTSSKDYIYEKCDCKEVSRDGIFIDVDDSAVRRYPVNQPANGYKNISSGFMIGDDEEFYLQHDHPYKKNVLAHETFRYVPGSNKTKIKLTEVQELQ